MLTLEPLVARRIRVRGVVQGVGFRPCIVRLARALTLRGWVRNDDDGVLIHVEGEQADVDAFARRWRSEAPREARVEAVVEMPARGAHMDDFNVHADPGGHAGPLLARVPADRALCADCRAEILDSDDRRHEHPFASCTACGPRYSILREMPYERQGTSMACFPLCPSCRAEYENPQDRRFHAEPIACPQCGPRLRCSAANARHGDRHAIRAAAEALRSGQILALKGLGGYQLLVRADRDSAVLRLRERKNRPSKPFAVMVRSIEEAERIVCLSAAERQALLDPSNPIVLLKARGGIAAAVAPALHQVGVLLPTTPWHALLLEQLDFPIVATSGNRSEEPIAIDDAGRETLQAIADVFLEHDRQVMRRVDDSVVRVIDEQPTAIRLARGLAPCALPTLERWASHAERPIPPIFAVGGQQKTSVALWTGAQAVLTQHLGDMDSTESRRAFANAIDDFAKLYRCQPNLYAGDLHPDYCTTRWALSSGLPLVQVQHHHAHAVSCMVEHDLLDRSVLAVVFDGTGFGPDGTIWGGEILQASMSEFRRIDALKLFALPGGEAAIHEPNRIALALLAETFGAGQIPLWLLDRLKLSNERAGTFLRMIERHVQSPRTSSVGRLFDGAAALLLGACRVTYEGEAAVLLEAAVDPSIESAYPIEMLTDQTGVQRGDWRPMVRSIVDDLANDVAVGVCAARFHNALATWSAALAASSGEHDVVLGGGCFQNAHLLDRTRTLLEKIGKRVHVPGRIPANDGGLSVGQLAVAMARWSKQK